MNLRTKQFAFPGGSERPSFLLANTHFSAMQTSGSWSVSSDRSSITPITEAGGGLEKKSSSLTSTHFGESEDSLRKMQI